MTAAEKKYTERDVVLRERKAFERGAAWFFCTPAVRPEAWDKAGGDEGARVAASEVFPLPMVERPREVRDNHGFEWRVRDDVLEYRYPASAAKEWQRSTNLCSEDRRRTLADLLANPTELVEDDGEVTP